MIDRETQKKAIIDAKRRDLLEEEAHLARLKSVFGSGDGIAVLEWLLDVSGYWSGSVPDERAFGKFELGRFVFNQVCLADLEIAHKILDGRRVAAENIRRDERRRIEEEAFQLKIAGRL